MGIFTTTGHKDAQRVQYNYAKSGIIKKRITEQHENRKKRKIEKEQK
jgi:hypothetical protein